ncbi:DUF2726 domain-containing protein [Methyloterricola oryzae]|uniref:DUF2726 domain-containing protein n=1 Tax=Methyloterricola oryzae TaxID=1495050 RepID=UPI0005EB8456|nr:DUF2726 domain-containing protein [Methyloterricola oryzae]
MEILSSNGVLIAAVLVLSTAACLIWFLGGAPRAFRHPYQKHTALFSPDDRVFYHALRRAVGDSYEIFAKIRVGDIILPKKGVSRSETRLAFSPITGRQFDFVLCEQSNMTVACVIQLNDKTNPARMPEAGDPIRAVCESVALPYVSFQIQADYPAEDLRERLQRAMSREPFYLAETDGRVEPHISSFDDLKF